MLKKNLGIVKDYTMKNILFVISKQSGFSCLKSFVNSNYHCNIEVITLDDRSDIRSVLDEVVSFCSTRSIDCSIVKNNQEFTHLVQEKSVYALFVCGWYWIISQKIITQVCGRIFGIHHSLLPKYRGFSPLVWSLINGDKEIGSSLFKITANMDEGDVMYQWKMKNEFQSVGYTLNMLEKSIANNFGIIFTRVLDNDLKGRKQTADDISYCARRTHESGRISWDAPADNVLNFINANSAPYPGAFFILENKKYYIDSAEIFEHNVFASVGQVVLHIANGVVIACNDGRGIIIKSIKNISNVKGVLYSLDCILE